MRQLFFLIFLFVAIQSWSQKPVQWSSHVQKVKDAYEVHLVAEIEYPWHVYSQTTPKGGPLPTQISFAKNPLVLLIGKPAEKGKLETRFEETFGVNVKYYNEKVEFIQVVKVKGNVKTNLSGVLRFMACTDQQCLSPDVYKFTVKLPE